MPEITTPDSELVAFRQDVHKLLRRRVLEAMEIVLEEELSEALGSGRYERSASRRGYRNGSGKRTVTTLPFHLVTVSSASVVIVRYP